MLDLVSFSSFALCVIAFGSVVALAFLFAEGPDSTVSKVFTCVSVVLFIGWLFFFVPLLLEQERQQEFLSLEEYCASSDTCIVVVEK